MNEAKRRFLLNALKLYDLALIVVSFYLATFLLVRAAHDVSLHDFLAMRVKLSNFFIFGIALFLCHSAFSVCGLYESRRLSTRLAESLDALKATAFATACLGVVSTVFSVRMITSQFLLVFWVIISISVIASRVSLQWWLAVVRRHGRNLRYMLILGTNPRAIEFARKILASPERGYELLGFVDEDWAGTHAFNETGFKLRCDYAGLAEFLRRNVVDEVAIYLPLRSFYEHSSHVAALCEQHGMVMRFASDIFGLKTARSRAEEFDGDHHIAAYTGVRDGWPLVFKRILDVSLSFAPLFLLLAALSRCCRADQAHLKGSCLFPPGTSWRQQTNISYLQIPHDGSRRRKIDRGAGRPESGFRARI